MDNRIVRVLLLVAAIVCFLGTAIFLSKMDPEEELRLAMLGLAFFAASFVP